MSRKDLYEVLVSSVYKGFLEEMKRTPSSEKTLTDEDHAMRKANIFAVKQTNVVFISNVKDILPDK